MMFGLAVAIQVTQLGISEHTTALSGIMDVRCAYQIRAGKLHVPR